MGKNKKSKPIGKIILIVFLIIALGIGVYGTVIGLKDTIKDKKREEAVNKTTTEELKLSQTEKTFSCDNFSITLTEDFETFDDSAIELGCAASGIEFFVIADTFEAGSEESKMTATEYVDSLVVDFDGGIRVSEFEGVPYAEYIFTGETNGITKNYRVFCYKGAECFWMVHFLTESEYSNAYKPHIFEWVKTIEAK